MKCVQQPPPCKLAANAMEHNSKQRAKKTAQLFNNSPQEQSLDVDRSHVSKA